MRTLQILFFIIAVSLSLSSQGKKENEGNFRLLYWNIQNGMWDGQTDDYQRFTSCVEGQKPDICVWCEAQKLYVTGTA
ncbi:MAG: endonuclease, partial [Bacteroidaceae bacterium]|nr:endonuclease [Bacteroidaceae bacterium]